MTTLKIESTAVAHSLQEHSSVKLAVEAGEACIANSGAKKSDFDLLINIGMYRDRNILEPAMSSLIQKCLDLNNDPMKNGMRKMTFSFDVINGTPSFISAIQIIDSMIQTNESSNAIVVSSDSHPSQTKHDDFPFSNFGAAAFITRNNSSPTRPQFFYNSSNNGYVGLKSHVKFQRNAQRILNFDIEDDYVEKMRTFAIESIRKGVETEKINLSDVKAVITVQPAKEFGQSITEGIGLAADMAIDTYDEYGDTYSSALTLGYNKGVEQGRIEKEDKVLFVAVGSGLSFGCCVI